MRILTRDEFLKMPAGTIYCKAVTRWVFHELNVKWETLEPNDWVCQSFDWVEADDTGNAFSRLEAMLEEGASFPLETDAGRDGCFEADALFMVMEHADLLEIKKVLDTAISVAAPNVRLGA